MTRACGEKARDACLQLFVCDGYVADLIEQSIRVQVSRRLLLSDLLDAATSCLSGVRAHCEEKNVAVDLEDVKEEEEGRRWCGAATAGGGGGGGGEGPDPCALVSPGRCPASSRPRHCRCTSSSGSSSVPSRCCAWRRSRRVAWRRRSGSSGASPLARRTYRRSLGSFPTMTDSCSSAPSSCSRSTMLRCGQKLLPARRAHRCCPLPPDEEKCRRSSQAR
eukprot:755334-Hanusia_phi.AAC.2